MRGLALSCFCDSNTGAAARVDEVTGATEELWRGGLGPNKLSTAGAAETNGLISVGRVGAALLSEVCLTGGVGDSMVVGVGSGGLDSGGPGRGELDEGEFDGDGTDVVCTSVPLATRDLSAAVGGLRTKASRQRGTMSHLPRWRPF